MSRPKRIQYEGACYHVTTRRLGDRPIASCDRHREMFVELLAELHDEFKAQIHAWCLTDDCYHLLITTPMANISRVMRHLNGVYTQNLNRQEHAKGSVFNGRYKSILIDSMVYLMHVGRRIHMTPQEEKLVKDVSEYLWSSYRNYLGLSKTPHWLEVKTTLDMLKEFEGKYDQFMSSEENPFVASFYKKKRLSNILGDKAFIDKVKKMKSIVAVEPIKKTDINLNSSKICRAVANVLGIDNTEVFNTRRGDTNIARLMAVYLHHIFAQYGHREIAGIFDFKQAGSVGSSIYRYKNMRKSFPELKTIEELILTELEVQVEAKVE